MLLGAASSLTLCRSLYLDAQIRNFVLFPITIVMLLVGILRVGNTL